MGVTSITFDVAIFPADTNALFSKERAKTAHSFCGDLLTCHAGRKQVMPVYRSNGLPVLASHVPVYPDVMDLCR